MNPAGAINAVNAAKPATISWPPCQASRIACGSVADSEPPRRLSESRLLLIATR